MASKCVVIDSIESATEVKTKSGSSIKSKKQNEYTPIGKDLEDEFKVINLEDDLEVIDISSNSNLNENLNSVALIENQPMVVQTSDPNSMNDEASAIIFESGTSIRKAETIANKFITDENKEISPSVPKPKNPLNFRQCNGLQCTKVARMNSKYCSDHCGVKLFRYQSQEQMKVVSFTADVPNEEKLEVIHRKQKELRLDIEKISINVVRLFQLCRKAKTSREDWIMDDNFEEEVWTLHCNLCGVEVPMTMLVSHLEHCFEIQARHLLRTDEGVTTKPDALEWNIFCNHKMGGDVYCKQLRVICQIHSVDGDRSDEVCGYPFTMNLLKCSGKFCGRLRENCLKHSKNWAHNLRADMDMQKFKKLLEFRNLEVMELDIKKDMAAKGNSMPLLMHQTILQ